MENINSAGGGGNVTGNMGIVQPSFSQGAQGKGGLNNSMGNGGMNNMSKMNNAWAKATYP